MLKRVIKSAIVTRTSMLIVFYYTTWSPLIIDTAPFKHFCELRHKIPSDKKGYVRGLQNERHSKIQHLCPFGQFKHPQRQH